MTADFDPNEDAWRSIRDARYVKLLIQEAVTAERERCIDTINRSEGDVDLAVFLIKRGHA